MSILSTSNVKERSLLIVNVSVVACRVLIVPYWDLLPSRMGPLRLKSSISVVLTLYSLMVFAPSKLKSLLVTRLVLLSE